MKLDEMTKFDSYPYSYDLTGILNNACSNPRTVKIDTITPHHVAGVVRDKQAVESICRYWAKAGASANYFIDVKGEIYLCVKENRRAWTSSNRQNDNRAITFEMSNDAGKYPWTISQATYKSAVQLSAYACKKYNIIPCYNGMKATTITTHRMFAATQCPGDFFVKEYLQSGIFVADIKKLLDASDNVQAELKPNDCYIQIGAYKKQLNAIKQAATLDGYSVYNDGGIYYVRRYLTKDILPIALETARAKYPRAFSQDV